MQNKWIFSAIMSCLVSTSFAQPPSYISIHTLGKPPIIKSKGTGILDLTELTKTNPHLVFAIKDPKSGEISYTRNSIFYNKNDGYYYQGHKRLQGYPVSADVASNVCELTDIKTPPEEIPAIATTTIQYMGNLNAADVAPAGAFDPHNPSSYNYTNTGTIYDSLGIQHELAVYYIKNSANFWHTNIYVDGACIGSGDLTFNTSGMLTSATGMASLEFTPTTGASSPQVISLDFDFAAFTQYGSPSRSNVPLSDGMPIGIYSSYMVDSNGYISFNYSNGQSITFSKVAVFTQ